MTPRRLLAPLLALLALAALPAAASAAGEIHQWTASEAPNHVVKTDTVLRLTNTVSKKALGHESRTGVDLGWKSTGAPFVLRREGRDHRAIPVRDDSRVAFYDPVGKRYLVHKGQTFGINLDWSKTPKYEWRVDAVRDWRNGDRTTISLYNTSAKDHLVYGSRRFGINLVWSGGGVAHMTVSVNRAQHEFPKGYAFFNGRTPLEANDRTIQARNVSGMPLLFRRYEDDRPGSTAPPSVVVGPGDLLLARDLEVIFGRKDPSLGWIRAWTPAGVPATAIALQVTYVDG